MSMDPHDLTNLERAVLTRLLAGDHPVLIVLREQAARAKVARREFTGVGFFCLLHVPPDLSPVAAGADFTIGDVSASIPGLEHGAGFLLFVRQGRLSELEAFSYEERWPSEVTTFTLDYLSYPRNLELPAS
jgi:hypothetical protein